MATLTVFVSPYNLSTLVDYVVGGTLTGTTTTFSYGFTVPSTQNKLAGTGTGLTYAGGNLTGGTINELNMFGVDGLLLAKLSGLAIAAVDFQNACDTYPANTGPTNIHAVFASQTWDSTGSIGADELHGGSSADVLRGGFGEDTFRGRGGNDVIDGGPIQVALISDDETIGLDYDTVIYDDGGAGLGIIADMRLATNQVRDQFGFYDTVTNVELIIGSALADTWRGSDGAAYEAFTGSNGADSIDGGLGVYDEVRYDRENGTSGVTVNLATGTATDSFGATDTIAGIEYVRGTARVDTITGDGNANRFRTYAGADVIDGGAYYDTVEYHQDANRRDTNGNSGTGSIRADLQAGWARDGWGNYDTLIAIENIKTSAYADRALGSNQKNYLIMGAGDDYADGRSNDDKIYGEDGNDILIGGSGLDFIHGGNGADRLVGGSGVDTMFGGAGWDTFVFDVSWTTGVDSITDYRAVDDTIELNDAIFTALTPGVLAGTAFVVGSAATTTAHRIVYTQTTGALFYDADGSATGAQVQFATLTTKPTITAADFVII